MRNELRPGHGDVARASVGTALSSAALGERWRPRLGRPSGGQLILDDVAAEYFARDWMEFLGAEDARRVGGANDAGIDVESASCIVQVKHWWKPVGPAPVRELFGAAAFTGKIPIFFSLGDYSSNALAFANTARIALIEYDAYGEYLIPCTGRAVSILDKGIAGIGATD